MLFLKSKNIYEIRHNDNNNDDNNNNNKAMLPDT